METNKKRKATDTLSQAKPSKRSCIPSNGSSTQSKKESSLSNVNTKSTEGIFSNMNFFILPAGIEKMRIEIFKTQVQKNGGSIVNDFNEDSNITHVIVDDKMDADRMLRLLKLKSAPSVPVIKSVWLSNCLRQKCELPHTDYQLQFPKEDADSNIVGKASETVSNKAETSSPVSPMQKPLMSGKVGFWNHAASRPKVVGNDSDSDYVASEDDDDEESNIGDETRGAASLGKSVPVEKWICAQSSKNPRPNANKHITDKLEEMVKAYESTNDKWRAFGYQKAIGALRRQPKEITTWEEAMSLPGVGKRLADKIWEIVESGQLRKLQELKSSDEVRVLELFTNVWGAGPTTAQQWYQQGFRSIQDLKDKAHLNHQQQVGVRLYDDLLDRMPREEAGEIEKVVREAAESIQPGIIAQACGSYRRGKSNCGDVDVLVTHPDGRSHKGVFSKLLAKLKETGFLTDDLVSAQEEGNQKKYLGVCKLRGAERKHRRLDIIVVPYSEYGCALVYFTGSAHFNRSLRHLCKKQNMSLNEHALKTGVVRKGAEKIYEGTVVPTPTEESVFTAMKIPYRPPEERDH